MGKKQLRVQVASTMLRNLTGSSLMRVSVSKEKMTEAKEKGAV